MRDLQLRQRTRCIIYAFSVIFSFCSVLSPARQAFAQVDQGAITGVVKDSAGAIIPSAEVTLTNTDTGLALQSMTDKSGVYVFSPIKIGNYRVSATAPGFKTTSQEHVHLDIQERLNIVISLKPGATSQTVTVSSAPPLLQSQSASVGQVVSTRTINNTPLNGRNWVYIAQLTAGVTPSMSNASRGGGTGDFFANGQRATQNNFILDGIDNNVNVDDFMNGASYNVRPPPDALAEFKIDTADYSAEFGHSAGAVLNASIKSGTNQIHGDVWEYFRNTNLDAQSWNAPTIPPYHENQFGATLGFPILRNKLFYFGDAEANRITFGQTATLTVPTPLMRQGNFSELLDPSLTGSAQPIQLYQPNSGGVAPLSCIGVNNAFCPNQIDSVASTLVNLFPSPNANGGRTYNNLVENLTDTNNTWQWDQRADWNISSKNQAYARYSYQHQQGYNPPPLGPILDGISDLGVFQGTQDSNLSESLMASDTHIFNPSLINELRFGYNWGNFSFLQENYDKNISAEIGLGGVPFGPDFPNNGGLPEFNVNNLSSFGSPGFIPSIERQNVYQILDNVTKIIGNHSLKFGIALESIRTSFAQPQEAKGQYNYTGLYTSNLGASFTGSALADLLADQMNNTYITPDSQTSYYRWNRSAYAEDDWRATTKLTLNLGIRYDYFQPFTNSAGDITNLVVTPPFGGIGTGTGVLQLPSKLKSRSVLAPAFLSLLAANNVTVEYLNNLSLATAQKDNFAPRIGFAYQTDPKTVIRGGFGIFYGGLESIGGGEGTVNYPWAYSVGVVSPNCAPGSCPSDGVTLENGLSTQLAAGIQNFISLPSFNATDPHIKTPYSESYNLTLERSLAPNVVATVGYVGNVARHLATSLNPNNANALQNPSNTAQFVSPFPTLGSINHVSYTGISNYNALQAKLEKRYANGLSFLATYTWSHAMDDSTNPGGIQSGVNDRNTNLIPIQYEYTNSAFDVRNRFTLNGFYQLPFGKGRSHMNQGGWTDIVAGGWAASLTFTAQTGTPFTVVPDVTTASGIYPTAVLVGNPFAPGGVPDPSNPGVTCPTSVRNRTNWYNPCAFRNPLPGSLIPLSGAGSEVTGLANAIAYGGGVENQIHGPGYHRTNMSVFKNFSTYHSQYLQFRIDIFNLLNHPSWANPSVTSNNSNGGQITAPQVFQNYTPDARFFQISGKYVF
ncbi:MAG: carboxypeptidase regulatory-like domain-containing protein [Acidobacteriaceae bacterium]